MTTLCLDFGNTRLKAAVFEKGVLKEEMVLPDDCHSSIEQLLDQHQPVQTILASVIDHPSAIEALIASRSSFHRLTGNSQLNFSIAVGKKESIGADRLALLAAAVQLFPQTNTLIIGLGSCITYNFINQYHQFLGGSISPGLEMRFKALHTYTAKLPLVEAAWNIPLIGYDTSTNIQSGVITGMACEIDGMIDQYSARYGNFNVVLTGGNSMYFASQLKNRIFADANFLFKGLYALSEINNRPNS